MCSFADMHVFSVGVELLSLVCTRSCAFAGEPDYDPTTLHIPDAALKAMTKFNAQFWNIKRKAGLDQSQWTKALMPCLWHANTAQQMGCPLHGSA